MESPGRPQRQRKTKSALELLGITPSKKLKKEPPETPSAGKPSADSGGRVHSQASTPQRKTRASSTSETNGNITSKCSKSTALKKERRSGKDCADNVARAGGTSKTPKLSPPRKVDSAGGSAAVRSTGRNVSRTRSRLGQTGQEDAPGDSSLKNSSKRADRNSNEKDVLTTVESVSKGSLPDSPQTGRTRQQLKDKQPVTPVGTRAVSARAKDGRSGDKQEAPDKQDESVVKSQQAVGARGQRGGVRKALGESAAGKKRQFDARGSDVATDITQASSRENRMGSVDVKQSCDDNEQSPARKSRRLGKEVGKEGIKSQVKSNKSVKSLPERSDSDEKPKDTINQSLENTAANQGSGDSVGKVSDQSKQISEYSESAGLSLPSPDQKKVNDAVSPSEKLHTISHSSQALSKSVQVIKSENQSDNQNHQIDNPGKLASSDSNKSADHSSPESSNLIPQALVVIDLPLKPTVHVVRKPSDITNTTQGNPIHTSGSNAIHTSSNNCEQTSGVDSSTDPGSYVVVDDGNSRDATHSQSGEDTMEASSAAGMIPVMLTDGEHKDQCCYFVPCEEVTTEVITEPATTDVSTSSGGHDGHLVGEDSHLVELTDTAEEHEVAETLAALTSQPTSATAAVMNTSNLSASDKLPLALMQGIGTAKEAIVTWTVDSLGSDEGNTSIQGNLGAKKPLKYRVEVQSVASHQSRAHLRARPVKHYAVTDHFQDLVDKLEPHDDISNHVRFTGAGQRKRMNCTYCDKVIADRHMFRRHILEHPMVQFRPWKCPLCPYAANIKAQIARHINIHADVKPFICKECGRGFNFKQKLNLHMKYHMNKRDSKCPHCSMAFHEYKTLKNHLRKIHGINDMPRRRKPEKEVPTNNKRTVDIAVKGKPVDNDSPRHAAAFNSTVHSMTDPETHIVESTDKQMEIEQSSFGMVGNHVMVSMEDSEKDPSNATMITHVELEEEVASTEEVVEAVPIIIIPHPSIGPTDRETERQTVGDITAQEDKQVAVMANMEAEAVDAVKSITGAAGHEENETILTNLDSGNIVSANNSGERGGECGGVASVGSGPQPGGSVDGSAVKEEDKLVGREADSVPWTIPVFRRRSSIHTVRKIDKKTFEFQSQVDALQGRPVKPQAGNGEVPGSPLRGKKTWGPSGPGRRGRWLKVTDVSQLEEGLRPYCNLVKSGSYPEHMSFGCQLCTTVLTCKTSFIHHLEKSHPDVKAWKCSFCSYTCRLRSSLIVHTQLHTEERRYKCEICEKTFRFKQKLHIHMKYHRNLREHECTQCTAAFNDRNDLTKHVRRVHIGDRPYVCQLCGKAYKEKTLLKNHMESHGGVKKYLCQQCNKFYRSKVSLAQHMKSHTCMFHCEICNKSFGSYSGFMAHKVMHDESYGGYLCSTCNKVLHTKGSLARHIAVVHSESRDFICSHCPKRFKTKKDLQSHESRFNVHHPEKYTCLHCDMAFQRLGSLQAHMEQHGDLGSGSAGFQASKIPETLDRPFVCGTCGQKFNDKDSLLSHVQEHILLSPQPSAEDSLQSELPAEQDEKRSLTIYMCEECNFVFLSQDNLAGHILAEHMRRNWASSDPPDTRNMVLLDEVSASELRSELQEVIIDSENSELLVAPSMEGVAMGEVVVGESASGEDIGCMVEVVTLDGNATHGVSSDATIEATTETMVSISHPSGSKSHMVTLVHPVVSAEQSEDSTAVCNLQREEGKAETEAEQKFAALLYDQGGEEPLISVAGSADNPLLVANVQSDSFQTILAAAASEQNSQPSAVAVSSQPAAVAVSSAQEDTLYIVQEDVDGTHTIVLPPVNELNDKWAQLKQPKLE